MTTVEAKTYTRADVQLLGELPMEGPYSTANMYQLGDNFYLITRYRLHGLQNEVIAKAGLGYDKSYDEQTQMGVVKVANQHFERPWETLCTPWMCEDEERGIAVIVNHANGPASLALLEERMGAEDITDLAIMVEAEQAVQAANEVDEVTDPLLVPTAEMKTLDDEPWSPKGDPQVALDAVIAEAVGEQLDENPDEPQGPEPTVEDVPLPDGNTDEINSD